MNKTLTKKQEERLERYLESVKNDDDHPMTMEDQFLEIFLPAKRGIRNNGHDILALAKIIGINEDDIRQVNNLRSLICNFVKSMVKDGYAFGPAKCGNRKKYGWATEDEWEEIEFKRKERMVSEIGAGLHYLDGDDRLSEIGKKFMIEFDKQIKLFSDK
jgi:hypothetical protein